MRTKDLNTGERVFISGGKYKGRYGTYMGPYGPKKVMCCVTIDGDTVHQRNLWLSSVTPVPVVEARPIFKTDEVADEDIRRMGRWSVSDDWTETEPTVKIKTSDLEKLLQDVTEAKSTIDDLEKKLKQLLLVRDS